ncbi:MAG: hypothetical protein ABSC92_09485 [Rhizomicrobium sp.]|jgi:hypothetical protein
MAGKETTNHSNGTHPPTHRAARATARATKRKAVARATKAARGPGFGRMIATGALAVLGVVFVLGAASFVALMAGYEPPGQEARARRLRRYTLAHTPDIADAVHAWEPVGKQIGRGERWMRHRIHEATR